MSDKKLKIKLLPNGEIQMETHGIKGKNVSIILRY